MSGAIHGYTRTLRGVAWLVVTFTAWAALTGWATDPVAAASRPANVPTWQASDRATSCEPIRSDLFYSTLLVVKLGGERVRMDFDNAWDRNHNNVDGDDVWVIGGCQ